MQLSKLSQSSRLALEMMKVHSGGTVTPGTPTAKLSPSMKIQQQSQRQSRQLIGQHYNSTVDLKYIGMYLLHRYAETQNRHVGSACTFPFCDSVSFSFCILAIITTTIITIQEMGVIMSAGHFLSELSVFEELIA